MDVVLTEWLSAIIRWLHVIAGVMWICLLYYFNFVQIPTMPKVPAELKGGVSGFIDPAALFWFRWAALATIILGLGLASQSAAYTMGDAFTLGLLGDPNTAATVIGIGKRPASTMELDVTLRLCVDPAPEGSRYRGRAIKAGAPFTLTTERYVLKGTVLNVSDRPEGDAK